jgi:three-Cys-motif partner protein
MQPPPHDDGLAIRDAGPWVRDKLGILRKYMPAFGMACRNKAPEWFYVEGFAGPGVNRIRTTGEFVWGSSMLALQTEPAFAACLLVDLDEGSIRALQARSEPFGPRAVIRRGDCNEILLPLMRDRVHRLAPCLSVMDPEGPHLAWETVVEIAEFKQGSRFKVEQLILLPTGGFIRELPLRKLLANWGERDLRKVFGGDAWMPIYERRFGEEITGAEARSQYVDLYLSQLRDLGYATVYAREVRTQGTEGLVLYYLVFTTDNPAGRDIMDSCIDYLEPLPELGQGTLFEVPPLRPRRFGDR